jgi:hypothetical protein
MLKFDVGNAPFSKASSEKHELPAGKHIHAAAGREMQFFEISKAKVAQRTKSEIVTFTYFSRHDIFGLNYV